jgi:transposase
MLLYFRKGDGADLSKSKDRSMDKEEKQAAKRCMMELMQAGSRWQEAATQAGVQTSRSTAYRWWQAYRKLGERALQDGRHGHPTKAHETVLAWLESTDKQEPQMSSRVVQAQLKERFDLLISITHLNRLRSAHGRVQPARREEKKSGSLLIV